MVRTESNPYMQKGDVAPDFNLPDVISGRTSALKDFGGKEGVLIIFMCNHCPYVKARVADIVALHVEFGDRIAVIGINSSDPQYPGEGIESSKEFAREQDLEFPYLYDEDGSVAKLYGATCTPDPFLFDENLKLVFHGRITDASEPEDETHEYTMRENILKLLRSELIEPWFNPSLGCSIKFKS